MTYLGLSNIDVYPLCLGTNPFGWTCEHESAFAVMDAYVSGGGNFIDTADMYSSWASGNQGGESETIIGEWLHSRQNRQNIVLATKVGLWEGAKGLSRASIELGLENSLRRLQTDYVDVYYAHREDLTVEITETVQAFADLQAAGKIRQVGLSNHSAQRIHEWMQAADSLGVSRPTVMQPHYNLVFRREYEENLQSVVADFSLSTVPYWGLASGFLTGKYQRNQEITGERAHMVTAYASDQAFAVMDQVQEIASGHNVETASIAIAWLLAQPNVAAPIASASHPDQVPALLEGACVVLAEDELAVLDELSAGLPQV